MAVPMRTVDQVKYATKLPDPFHLGVAGRRLERHRDVAVAIGAGELEHCKVHSISNR